MSLEFVRLSCTRQLEGKAYCLLEAPDADAVRRHHAFIGVPCGEVHQVTGIL